MSRRKRISPRAGDVFAIPVGPGARAYGQVIAAEARARRALLVVVFRSTDRGEPPAIDDALKSGFDLAGVVFDAKLLNGDWPTRDNRPTVATASLWFVSGHAELGNLRLTAFDGTMTRPCTEEEASRHRRRSHASPMVLEMAASAARGFAPWKPEFDRFRDYARELQPERN